MTGFLLRPMPSSLRFTDADPAELARDEPAPRRPPTAMPAGQWSAYLTRLLPPVAADPPEQAGAPSRLRTEAGMADFLASLGPQPARTLAGNLGAFDRSGFWHGVQRELASFGVG